MAKELVRKVKDILVLQKVELINEEKSKNTCYRGMCGKDKDAHSKSEGDEFPENFDNFAVKIIHKAEEIHFCLKIRIQKILRLRRIE